MLTLEYGCCYQSEPLMSLLLSSPCEGFRHHRTILVPPTGLFALFTVLLPRPVDRPDGDAGADG